VQKRGIKDHQWTQAMAQAAIDTGHLPKISGAHVCIVKSKWYQEFSDNMERACIPILEAAGVATIDTEILPGCLEMPLAIKFIEKNRPGKYDAYICLGILMKGQTFHFEMIMNETIRGLGEVMLEFNKPIIVEIIPALSIEQAKARTEMNELNKGIEAAAAAVEILAWRRANSKS
jgi:6,7-dimethyl-8-ribityllumazine synthase